MTVVVSAYQRWRGCYSKELYLNEAEAVLACRSWRQRKVSMTFYRCDHCGMLHLATKREAVA